MRVKIYVEGGGESNALRTKCREGFSRFFQKAGFEGRMPAVVACGSRDDAYDSFRTAIANCPTDVFPLLLVDSEAAVQLGRWEHLQTRDHWSKPAGASDDHAHMMVQCMEAWFLADRVELGRCFGQGFRANSLPKNPDPEAVAKDGLLKALHNATRQCKAKRPYNKGEHSFELLGKTSPQIIVKVSRHAQRLLAFLETRL